MFFKPKKMKSKTITIASNDELRSKVNEAITENFQPTLAIVFNSLKNNIEEIQALFNDKGIDLIGCTTAGEIVNAELFEESVAILLMDINRDFYTIKQTNHGDNLYKNALQTGQDIEALYENIGLIIMISDFAVDTASIVTGIKDGIGKEVPMYGGLAADDLQVEKTYVFSNTKMTSEGSVILVIDTDKIEMSGLATSGWEAIGLEKTITKSVGNVIHEIDNERAYDIFIRYFGLMDKSHSMEHLLSLQNNYPLQIIRNNDTILRTLLLMDETEGTITLMGGVNQGDKFKFSSSPGFEVIEQTISEFQDLKDNSPEVDALLLFSCKGRHLAFGPLIEDEIEGLYNYWKTPMIGFLAYGEIGNTPNGICEIHNETCSLVTFREKT
jgi:hypothetical protein